MKPARLLIAIVVAFIVLQVTDGVLHGVCLSGYYGESTELWRPSEVMNSFSFMWANLVGHFIMAIAITLLFNFSVISNDGTVKCAMIFAGTFTLLQVGTSFIMWSVQPLPASYYVLWTVGILVQMILVSLALYAVLRKKASD